MEIKRIEHRRLDGFEYLQRETRLLTCMSLLSVGHLVAYVELVDGLISVLANHLPVPDYRGYS